MEFYSKSFDALTKRELYYLLQLRSDVFVVEQDCVFLDLDGNDEKAIHVLGYKGDEIVAYTRLFKPGDYYKEASVGRVVVKKEERKFKYGHELMKFSIETVINEYKTKIIKIGAQKHLHKFYESHGFKQIGDEYLEDGIMHIYMIKN